MAKKLSDSAKLLVLLLGVLLAWWLLPTVVKSLLRISFFEFQAPAWTAASFFHDLQQYWAFRNHSKFDLFEAGRDLARLNAAYELRLQENEALRAEVARLEQLLNLPSHPEYRYEIARVIRRDASNWWQQFIIRKGRNYAIPKGAAVVFSGGVVGRIKEVYFSTATVELISSPTFRMAAHFADDDRPVTFQGGINKPFRTPQGEILYVPPDITLLQGAPRQLVSSRLGGVFPDGLTIGWVEHLIPNADGLFQRGRLRLDKKLLSLKEVAVLIPIITEMAE